MALLVLTALLAAAMLLAAARKIIRGPGVVEGYARAGVPESRLTHLAVILLAGAAGLVLGLLWTPLGLAASAATALYFAVAVGFHIRAGDRKNVGMPLLLGAMAATVLVLHAT